MVSNNFPIKSADAFKDRGVTLHGDFDGGSVN